MAAKSSSSELAASLAAKAAQIPSLRAVRLEADYVPARLPSGKVTGIWGEAFIRTPDGDLRPLVVGDEIRKGDVIMTTQNGIVEIDDAGTRLARFPGTDALEQILTDLPPTGAGLSGGDPGSLLPGVRVDRINESVDGQAFAFDAAERGEGQAFIAATDEVLIPTVVSVTPVAPDSTGDGVPDVIEGTGAGNGNAVSYTVTLSSGASEPFTFSFGVTGTGTNQADPVSDLALTFTNGVVLNADGSTITVPANVQSFSVTIVTNPDTIDEENETFNVSIGGVSGTVSIIDDDAIVVIDIDGPGAGNARQLNYTENDAASPIAPAMTLADPDSNIVSRATVSITGAFTVGEDVLAFTAVNGIASNYVAETGVLTFTGTATLAQYQTLLQSVTYFNPSENPTATPRTVSFVVYDEIDRPSVPALATVNVIPVNDAPTNLPVVLAAIAEDSGVRVITQAELLANAADVDNTTLSVVGLTASSGTLVDNGNGTWNYTPALNDDTAVSFTYSVSDGSLSVAGSAAMDITPVNDAPVNTPAVLAPIAEDSVPRVITQAELLTNASDVDSPALTAENLVITAGGGTLVDNNDGTWTYTPAPDDDTTVSFDYTVTDGSLSVPGSVTLDITPVNDAPVTTPVVLTAIAEDSVPRVITQAELLANASDIDSNTLTATGLTIAAGAGSLVDNGNGTWTYTPALNDDSSVSFNYTVSDGALSVPGTATLDITPVNDAPVNTPVTLAAIAEDSGARIITQAELLANATDVDGPALTAAGLTITAGNGILVNNNDGTWTYTPAPNDDGAVSFSYTVSDGSLSVPGSAAMEITPVNDAPVTTPVVLAAIGEDSGARIITQAELLANATDVDSTTLTATGLTVAAGAGSLVDNGNGTWTYTPALNDDSAVSFNYSVSDGALSVPATATLDITPVNDAPTNTPVTLASIAEDSGPRTITQVELLANAADIDGPALTASGLAIATGNGTLVNNNDGTWTYTPAPNDDTAVSFNYTVSDGSLSVGGSASMDITPVDDAPVNTLPDPTTNLDGVTTNEDTPLFFSVANGNAITVFDADIVNDAGTLTTTISVAQGTFTLGSTNGVTVSGNGSSSVTVSGTPTAINAALNGASYRNVADFFTHNSNGGFIDSAGIGLTVTTTDSTNLPDTDSTSLVVRAVTDVQIVTRVTNEGQATTPFTLASLVNVNDPGSGFEGAGPAITAINGTAVAAGGSVTVLNGVVTLTGDQSLVFTPNAGFTATAEDPASFTYTVASGGRTETAAFFVQVDPIALPVQASPGVAASSAESIQSINAASTSPTQSSVDVFNGSVGSDVFAWHLGDAGTAGSPRAYTVNDFDAAPASAGGDVLDLRDLLVGENADNLGAFLDFSKSGVDTVISISSTGSGAADQTITLTNLDLAATIGLAPDASEAQMITALINQGKLLVDTAA